MSCVTPADLGKPIAAIVERCGTPAKVISLTTLSCLFYAENDQGTVIWFDADQMRARIVQFGTIPVTLPFESGTREIVLGKMTLPEVQSALAADADVTTEHGAAFRSTARNDVVLNARTGDHVLDGAFVGERTSLVQLGIIASKLGEPPLDYVSPIPLDAWLRAAGSGSRTTIFRIEVDKIGIVRKVTIVVASGDAAFDASTQQRLGDAKFRPATLEKRPVAGTSFVQMRH